MGRKRLVVNNRLMHHSIVFQIRRFRFLAQCSEPCPFLFRMKITTSITKSSHQDHIQGYLHLTIFFFLYIHSSILLENLKNCYDLWFLQQIRPQTTIQWYIFRDYSRVRIDFHMITKRHTLPVVYTMLVKIR